jgi:hypothetical protein
MKGQTNSAQLWQGGRLTQYRNSDSTDDQLSHVKIGNRFGSKILTFGRWIELCWPDGEGCRRSRYQHYYIFAPSSKEPVANIIARCMERNENYSLYKEHYGSWHFCASPHEYSNEEVPNIVAVDCKFWLKDYHQRLLASVAGYWGVSPETETMHEITGYDA